MYKHKPVRSFVTIFLISLFLTSVIDVAFSPKASGEIGNSNSITSNNYFSNPAQLSSSPTSESKNKQLPDTSEDWWSFDNFKPATSLDEIKTQFSFAVDGDFISLVIGVDTSRITAYGSIVSMVDGSNGKVVNTVSIGGKVIAVVARVPLTNAFALRDTIHENNLARYIEPRMKFQALFTPNDPYWSVQWGPQKIEANNAWNTTTGSHSVLVAIIDTGIDYTHPDLNANYIPLGYDWVNNDPDPLDDHGHGTHCAGIIAATMNNSIGIAGVANVSIMAEKALDAGGSGYEDGLANAIIDAVDQGANILSNSWGGYGISQLIYDAVKYAYAHGVLVVAAAGNDGWTQKPIPAGYAEVVAVTATDSADSLASFSNYGDWVEVAAPGVSIYSTLPTYHVTLNDLGYSMNYDYLSGTSMACPHTSAVAALIWSRFPNATRDWVRAQLRFTADDLGFPGFDEYYGYGRLNARKAVEQTPPNHDLLIYEWKKPQHIQPGDTASFNIAVMNFGESDEQNVTIQLIVDGSVTNSTTVNYLVSSAVANVSLSWNPLAEGTYNVTLYVVPALGETVTENNFVTEMFLVRYPVGSILFDQTRCDTIDYYSSWVKNLTETGYIVDTYAMGPISSEVLADYDIFVVPQAYSSYSPEEIMAIQEFVRNGGGLLVIGDYDPVIYTSLTNFADIAWTTYFGAWRGYTGDITEHEVTEGVTTAYFEAPMAELLVNATAEALIRDGYGYNDVMLAVSEVESGRVICIADEDTVADWAIAQADNSLLASNMIDWLLGVQYQHELVVRLDTPYYLEPGAMARLNATVRNRGLENETNVEIRLLVDGTVMKNATVPLLVKGTEHTINFVWAPSAQGTYNITAYAPPVASENITLNNRKTNFVSVHFPLINPFPGQYAKYVMRYYDSLGNLRGPEGYWNITYEYYVNPYKMYVTMSQRTPDGYVSTAWLVVDTMTRYVDSGVWAGWWYMGWIETGLNVGSTINLFDGSATVNGSKLIAVGPRAIDCWQVPYSVYGFPYSFWYDKTSGLWVCMVTFDTYGQRMEVILSDTNIPIGTFYAHDLGVTLESPAYLRPGDVAKLNATVYNVGLSYETNVEVVLYVNGTEVANEVIDELVIGASHVLSYSWTPADLGMYNITAYAPVMFGESVSINNIQSKIVNVHYAPRILAYVEYTDYIGEYQNTLNAIMSSFGPDFELAELWNYTDLESMIVGKDILLIPEQEMVGSSTLAAIGGEWSGILSDFVENGGVVIVCDYSGGYGGSYGILTGAGLMSISSAYDRSFQLLYVADATDPLADGVSSPFYGQSGTLSFLTAEEKVVISDGTYPVVIHKGMGSGHVVLIGFDYFSYNLDEAQIIGNAVNLALTVSLSINPSCGSPGTEVRVSGTKATVTGTVSVYWDDVSVGNATCDDFGNFEYYLVVPFDASVGVHEVKVVDVTTGRTASVSFRVFLLVLNPAKGPAGTKVALEGAGFTPEAWVNVTFNDELLGHVLVDDFGNFSFVFNVPFSAGGSQLVKVFDVEGIGSVVFNVVDVTPLDVQVDVGVIHFRGEIAEFYVLIAFKGKAVGAIVTGAVLYKPDGLTEILMALPITTGLYKLLYSIDGNASVGAYTLVVTASYVTDTVEAEGTSFKSFLLSSTLESMNAVVQGIQGDIATIIVPSLGTIKANLTELDAKIVGLNGTVADIWTDIGTMQVSLDDIRLRVIGIDGKTATIQTILGVMNGTITSIDDNVATIVVPSVGQIQADVSGLVDDQKSTGGPLLQYVAVVLSLVAAAGAVSAVVLLSRRKKVSTGPTTEVK